MINESNQLSEREREILQLVANGLSNQQIANELGISINTVKVHLRNLFSKIGVASRTEATMYAVRSGIVLVDRLGRETPPDSVPEVKQSPALVPEVATLAPPQEPAPDVRPVEEASFPAPLAASQAILVEEPLAPTTLPSPHAALPPALLSTPSTPVAAKKRTVPRWWLIGAVLGLIAVVAVIRSLNLFSTPTAAQNAGDAARWRQFPDTPTHRAGFAIANVGDYVYLVGGQNESGVLNSVERYDTRSGSWTQLSNKPTPVTDVRGVLLGGKIYVPGGRTANTPGVTNVFERYDPVAETWEKLTPLPQPRSGYALATLEGKLYLIGGWDGTTFRRDVFEYDPDRSQWRERTAMPTARAYMDAAVVGNNIYVLGGENETGQITSNEVYSPAQEGSLAWTRRAPLPKARSHFGATAASTIIHVVGGRGTDIQPIKYNVRTDSWQSFSVPPQMIGSQPGVILQDEMMLSFGGKTNDSTYVATMQGYQALYTIYTPAQAK